MPDFVLTSMTLKAALTLLILMAAAYSFISEKLAPIAISIAAMLALEISHESNLSLYVAFPDSFNLSRRRA
jgi:hypothetical protein